MFTTTNRPVEKASSLLFSSLLFSSLLLIFSLVGTSCEKDLEMQKDELPTAETLTDVAHFQSQESFEKAMQALKNEGILPKEIQGITTLSQAGSLKSASLEASAVDTLIYSDLLKSVLNQNYEIAIGDVFVRITRFGTLLTDITQYQWLRELPVDSAIFHYCRPTTSALGYFSENGLYTVTNHNNLYLFDSFREIEKLDPISEGGSPIVITPSPADRNWLEITCDRTLFGELWDNIWGFSVSARNYFDNDNRVDVKFYAQDFLFYAEMGIKTKTQTRGWTGFWRKRYADEIINGWEVLNLREHWPYPLSWIFGIPEAHNLPSFNFLNQTGRRLGFDYSFVFANVFWAILDIWRFEIDFTNKNNLGEFWNFTRTLGWGHSVRFENNRFVNPRLHREGIRFFPDNFNTNETLLSLGPYERRRANTEKFTLIMHNDSGGEATVTFPLEGLPTIKGTAELNYRFLPNSVMYGAARIGNTWKGVRITIK